MTILKTNITSLGLRFEKIYEERNYLLEKIKHNELFN